MFSKNLKYYRLKNNLSKKELASLINVSSMAISNYESGKRMPDMEIIKALANALNVKVSDFLIRRNEKLHFMHGDFRKGNQLSQKQQDYMKETMEEYVERFYSIVNILGDNVLPEAPLTHQLELESDNEVNALNMRKYLKISESGPVGNLIELLENKGIIVYLCNESSSKFYGMNGSVNNRPYIIINDNMSPERIRSTIAHELAHFIFNWHNESDEKKIENIAIAIGGAFLFPKEDAIRELGIRRTRITHDMVHICKEYGISMYMLVKRARVCNIISEQVEKNFYIKAGKQDWKTNEPIRIKKEEPMLFSQLVFRAVCENEITIEKGAELLKTSYDDVAKQCFGDEV